MPLPDSPSTWALAGLPRSWGVERERTVCTTHYGIMFTNPEAARRVVEEHNAEIDIYRARIEELAQENATLKAKRREESL